VRLGASAAERTNLLRQCKDAGERMHKICDNIPSCGGAAYTEDQKKKFRGLIQACINSRRSITGTWYSNQGDEGHDTAIDDKINQLNRCLR
jgi:hypothetical protein